MNKIMTVCLSAALFLMTGTALAEKNYSALSTEELARLRSTLQNEPQEERAAFIKEWQKRVEAMTPEERAKYIGTAKEGGDASAPGGAQPNCQ